MTGVTEIKIKELIRARKDKIIEELSLEHSAGLCLLAHLEDVAMVALSMGRVEAFDRVSELAHDAASKENEVVASLSL